MSYTITALFPAVPDAKYDLPYYITHHMPLIERQWKKYGVKSWSVTHFGPDLHGNQPLYTFGSTVVWENEVGVKEAVGGPEAVEIMGDVEKFSNKEPVFLFEEMVA